MSMTTQADETWIIGESPPIKHERYSGGWLNQPIWEICSSNWESSRSRGEHKKYIWNHHLVFVWKPLKPHWGPFQRPNGASPLVGSGIRSIHGSSGKKKTTTFFGLLDFQVIQLYMAFRIKTSTMIPPPPAFPNKKRWFLRRHSATMPTKDNSAV